MLLLPDFKSTSIFHVSPEKKKKKKKKKKTMQSSVSAGNRVILCLRHTHKLPAPQNGVKVPR